MYFRRHYATLFSLALRHMSHLVIATRLRYAMIVTLRQWRITLKRCRDMPLDATLRRYDGH